MRKMNKYMKNKNNFNETIEGENGLTFKHVTGIVMLGGPN